MPTTRVLRRFAVLLEVHVHVFLHVLLAFKTTCETDTALSTSQRHHSVLNVDDGRALSMRLS
jgi:hypothetical protein